MSAASVRRGMTLVELVVVVAIVGVVAGVATLTISHAMQPPADDPARLLTGMRRRALRDGEAQAARLMIDSTAHDVIALPDGSVVADSGVPVDRFTARWRHVP